LWRKKDEEEKGRVMERRSRKERRFSCIEFSAKSESIIAEAIELSGANLEARPKEKLRSLVQSLFHHANCRPLALSLSLVVQMWARENTVAVSAFRARPPFWYPIFENLNDFRVYNSWRHLNFFCFFVARFRNLLASNFQKTNIHS